MLLVKHAVIFLSLFAFAFLGACQTTGGGGLSSKPRKTLSEELIPKPDVVKEQMRLGQEASQRQDWAAAIEHFEKAAGVNLMFRTTANDIPPVLLFNIGLANDRNGGREIPAVGYYRAFLALVPQAQNAEAIKQRIPVLLETVRNRIYKLMALFERAVMEFDPDAYQRKRSLVEIAGAKAYVGDIAGALNIAQSLEDHYEQDAYNAIVLAQAKAGDFAGAKKSAGRLTKIETHYESPVVYNHMKARALAKVAEMEAEAGALDDALATVNQVVDLLGPVTDDGSAAGDAAKGYIVIIDKLIENEKFAQARSLIPRLRHATDLRKDDPYFYYDDIVHAHMKLGEIDEARKVAYSVPYKKGSDRRTTALKRLAYGYASFGMTKEAREVLDDIDYEEGKFVRDRIEEVEEAKRALSAAKTAKEKAAAQKELRYNLVRPIGPYRFRDSAEVVRLEHYTISEIESDEWISFGRVSGIHSGIVGDSNKFLQDLQQNRSEYAITSASRSMTKAFEVLDNYKKLDMDQRARRQRLGLPVGS